MTNVIHPNIALIQQLDTDNLPAAAHLFDSNFIWHFFNPELTEIQGDYLGVEGLKIFFENLRLLTNRTFRVEPISLTPIGDELVIAHVVDHMTLGGHAIALDAVVVWRVVDGLIAEAWDIPSLYTEHTEEFAKSFSGSGTVGAAA